MGYPKSFQKFSLNHGFFHSMSRTRQSSRRSTIGFKYHLLNTQGLHIPGCYIEIQKFPTPSVHGFAMYHDFRGTVDRVKFTYIVHSNLFEAWHADAPTTTFTMKPITADEDVITDLEIRFDHLPNFVALFTWQDDEDDESDYFDSPRE